MVSRRSLASGFGRRHRLDLGNLQLFEDRTHRLPYCHDLGSLMSNRRRLSVLPREHLHEERLAAAFVGGAPDSGGILGDETDLIERRPMFLNERLQLAL